MQLSEAIALFTPKHSFADLLLPARFRGNIGRRAAGVALTLLIEGVLVLGLLSLAGLAPEPPKAVIALSTFAVSPDPEPDPEPEVKPEEPTPEPARQSPKPEPTPPKPVETPTPPVRPIPPTPAIIPLSREQMAKADISQLPAKPDAPASQAEMMGPANLGRSNDTPRTGGAGPNGEPLYAAAWYRQPYDDELRGYLSTAQGPGWGKIACQTFPDFRVDNCVIIDEYPKGSNIARAVLAASWQFRVRPPRVGGKAMIGEWVGIRIDYEMRR